MYKHWERRQGDNPAAKQLIARFKLALKKKKLTAEQLGEQAPLEQGEKEDGYEHLRGPGELPAEDVFSYSFELHSQEQRDWLTAEGSIFEPGRAACAVRARGRSRPSDVLSLRTGWTYRVDERADAVDRFARYFAIFRDI